MLQYLAVSVWKDFFKGEIYKISLHTTISRWPITIHLDDGTLRTPSKSNSLPTKVLLKICCCCLVLKLCLTLFDLVDCSLPTFSVHGIPQARILELTAVSFSRGSSRPRDWTQVSCLAGISCLEGRFFTTEPPGKPTKNVLNYILNFVNLKNCANLFYLIYLHNGLSFAS